MLKKARLSKGFTLIELLVAVGIFTIILTMSLGAIVSIISASKKARTLQTAINDLSGSMEAMAREIRFGKDYGCVAIGSGDCTTNTGSNIIHFRASDGSAESYRLQGISVERCLKPKSKNLNSPLPSSCATGDNYYSVTPSEIRISSLWFTIQGASDSGDYSLVQPRVIIVVQGNVIDGDQNTKFAIQTTISQRSPK